jgi:catechol 2,3-dioxygenase-like lactoylglutathione lyase family enzyme
VPVKFNGYIAVVFVSDLGRARDFYEKAMGLELSHADDTSAAFNMDPDTLVLLNHAGADDLLSPGDVDHGAGHGARSVLASQVEDVDAAYAELRSRGVEFIRPPEDRSWGLRCAHFKDPDGNVWELHTPLGEQ